MLSPLLRPPIHWQTRGPALTSTPTVYIEDEDTQATPVACANCPRTFWILEEHSDTGGRFTLHRLVIPRPYFFSTADSPAGRIPFGPRVSCAVVLISADTTAVLRLWLPPSSPGGATSSHPPSTWDGPNLASVQSPSAFWCIALVQHVSDLSIPPHSESTKTRTGEGNSPSPSSPLAHEFLVLRSHRRAICASGLEDPHGGSVSKTRSSLLFATASCVQVPPAL
ncbi:hypothetical protein B0H13DRAFT_2335259 [Mycena leptocephala]|nr:hypothetical protein B0H13DRAFT_2335259 [Mycena leptocephala]